MATCSPAFIPQLVCILLSLNAVHLASLLSAEFAGNARHPNPPVGVFPRPCATRLWILRLGRETQLGQHGKMVGRIAVALAVAHDRGL
jgi:hypothetical protein